MARLFKIYRIFVCAVLLLAGSIGTAAAASITLQWDPNPEADVLGYVVKYGTRPGVYGRTIDVGNRTTWTGTVDAPAGTTTYYFAVVAYSDGGTSDPSVEVSETFTVLAPRPIIELDYPRANQDLPPDMVLSGWAADFAAPAGPGIDAIHVYAYPDPGSGKPPVFLGVASYGTPRGDVAAAFGTQFLNSGYSVPVAGLVPGIYDVILYGRSTVTGTFAVQRALRTRVSPAPAVTGAQLFIDAPVTNSTVRGLLAIGGWAADFRASSGTGVDQVDLWAYPNPGSGVLPVFLGTAQYGGARLDVGQAFGARFAGSGWNLSGVRLAAGVYDVAAFARSTVTGGYERQRVARITVQPVTVAIDVPAAFGSVPGGFYVAGWTGDLRSVADSGIDAVHVWAYPDPGSGEAPVFLGVATQGVPRGDVAAAFGAPFAASGYFLAVPGLAPGVYDLVVYARSTASGRFEGASTVRVTVK